MDLESTANLQKNKQIATFSVAPPIQDESMGFLLLFLRFCQNFSGELSYGVLVSAL